MTGKEYWLECIQQAADECGLEMTTDQAAFISAACFDAHENCGQAFYSPPLSDGLAVIADENAKKLVAMKAEHDRETAGAELALKRSLGLYDDSIITVDCDGSVWLHNGNSVQIR